MNEQYYTDMDICNLMEISLSRLRAKICEGKLLPPRIEIPDSRTRLWDKKIVHNWLDKYTVTSSIEKPSIRRVVRQ